MAVEPVVRTRNLVHTYQDAGEAKEVLHGINMDIWPGSNVFLTGYSGSGKTTLISLVGCLRSVQSGSLQLLGEELRDAKEGKLRTMRQSIGYVFQHFNLLDFLSIRQNVQQSLEIQKEFSPREARKLSEEILDQVGLGDRVNAYPAELSGGQKQRVAIARALVHKPRLLLADEPTAALDTATGRDIIDLVHTLSRKQNSAAIIVTHNMRILDSADEILHMVDGRIGTAVTEQISLVLPNLEDRHLAEIAKETETHLYEPGQVIIEQGDSADAFYILSKGRVEVHKRQPGGEDQFVADIKKRGAFFGEMGLLNPDGRRQASVLAAGDTPVEVLLIHKGVFVEMCAASRATRAVIADEMMQRFNAGDSAGPDVSGIPPQP